ncbi:MAG: TolC family protein [Bacteroidales bacterium]|nr:TolC family protein [Bacteroidales bacterium]
MKIKINKIHNSIKMKNAICLLLLILPLLPVKSQETLTIETCRKMAVENSETLKQAEMTIEKARAEKKAVQTMYYPRLSGSFTGIWLNKDIEMEMYLPTVVPDPLTGELVPNIMTDPLGQPVTGPDGNPIFNMYAWFPLELSLKGAYMAGINIEQPVFTGGKILAGNKMAAIGSEMAQFNQELQLMNTIVEADQAYWLFISVNEKVKLAEMAVELLDSITTRVKNAYETGLVSENELLKAQVRHNKAKLDLQKARNGLQLACMSLCRVTGLDLGTQLTVPDTTIEINNELLLKAGSEDIARRPEYRLLEKNIALEAQKSKLTRADYLPVAGVRAGYNYLGGIDFGTTNYSTDNVSVMASLSIPIFHWGEGKQKMKSARLDMQIKELELEKNAKLLRLETEQARFNLMDAFSRVELSKNALAQADENLRVSRNNYELGRELMTDLLIAQTHWQEAYSELIDAKTDYKLKETIYLKASGMLAEQIPPGGSD